VIVIVILRGWIKAERGWEKRVLKAAQETTKQTNKRRRKRDKRDAKERINQPNTRTLL